MESSGNTGIHIETIPKNTSAARRSLPSLSRPEKGRKAVAQHHLRGSRRCTDAATSVKPKSWRVLLQVKTLCQLFWGAWDKLLSRLLGTCRNLYFGCPERPHLLAPNRVKIFPKIIRFTRMLGNAMLTRHFLHPNSMHNNDPKPLNITQKVIALHTSGVQVRWLLNSSPVYLLKTDIHGSFQDQTAP